MTGPVVDVAVGLWHACAVTADRSLYCWGTGRFGQLGTGDLRETSTPARVDTPRRFGAVAAGWSHSCALDDAGGSHCWGWNASGELGHRSTDAQAGAAPTLSMATPPAIPIASVPFPVVGGPMFERIAAAESDAPRTCGLAPGGDAWCWGAGYWGEHGHGAIGLAREPVRVGADRPFRAIDVGGRHTCAVAADGSAWCWGSNERGQLGAPSGLPGGCGVGEASACASEPVRVEAEGHFVTIEAGSDHTCALTREGRAWCWGANEMGQLGVGDFGDAEAPRPVASEVPFASLTAGLNHTCAIARDGSAWCWGNGNRGILGTQSGLSSCGPESLNRCSPVPVLISGGLSFQRLAAGGGTTCGIATDGRAYCWGDNFGGALGNGFHDGARGTPGPVAGQP